MLTGFTQTRGNAGGPRSVLQTPQWGGGRNEGNSSLKSSGSHGGFDAETPTLRGIVMCSPHPVHVIEVPVMSSNRFRMPGYDSLAYTSHVEADGTVTEVPYDANPLELVRRLLPLSDSEPDERLPIVVFFLTSTVLGDGHWETFLHKCSIRG